MKGSKIHHPKICLWHIILSWLLLRNDTGEALKTEQNYAFVRNIYKGDLYL